MMPAIIINSATPKRTQNQVGTGFAVPVLGCADLRSLLGGDTSVAPAFRLDDDAL